MTNREKIAQLEREIEKLKQRIALLEASRFVPYPVYPSLPQQPAYPYPMPWYPTVTYGDSSTYFTIPRCGFTTSG